VVLVYNTLIIYVHINYWPPYVKDRVNTHTTLALICDSLNNPFPVVTFMSMHSGNIYAIRRCTPLLMFSTWRIAVRTVMRIYILEALYAPTGHHGRWAVPFSEFCFFSARKQKNMVMKYYPIWVVYGICVNAVTNNGDACACLLITYSLRVLLNAVGCIFIY
jgi:hypothetical protein